MVEEVIGWEGKLHSVSLFADIFPFYAIKNGACGVFFYLQLKSFLTSNLWVSEWNINGMILYVCVWRGLNN